jgi:hypothetical protein
MIATATSHRCGGVRDPMGDDFKNTVEWKLLTLDAHNAFFEIQWRFGTTAAREVFREILKGPSIDPRAYRLAMVAVYFDRMAEPKNKSELARQLLEANKSLPVGERYGHGGNTDNFATMLTYVKRAIAEADPEIKQQIAMFTPPRRTN